MSCGCSSSPQTPQSPFYPNTAKPTLAVFDPVTGQVRPLAFGEAPPIPDSSCGGCNSIESVLPSAKHMQDAYFDLQRRLLLLEQKYCDCMCPEVGPDTRVTSMTFEEGNLCLAFNNPEIPQICIPISIPDGVHLIGTSVSGNNLILEMSDGSEFTQPLPIPAIVPDSWQSNVVTTVVTEGV